MICFQFDVKRNKIFAHFWIYKIYLKTALGWLDVIFLLGVSWFLGQEFPRPSSFFRLTHLDPLVRWHVIFAVLTRLKRSAPRPRCCVVWVGRCRFFVSLYTLSLLCLALGALIDSSSIIWIWSLEAFGAFLWLFWLPPWERLNQCEYRTQVCCCHEESFWIYTSPGTPRLQCFICPCDLVVIL